jgi:hypothetical protein
MPIKPKEDKTTIKQFRDLSSNWWCDMVHYHLNEQGELVFCAGGIDKEELRTSLLSFIRRNKKSFKVRGRSIFDAEEREWATLTFGKHNGLKLDVIKDLDRSYLPWLFKNTQDEKLKKEVEEILKIK